MKSNKMRKALARARQRGLTLIEAAMVLGIAALVIAGVLVLYNTANENNKTSDALNQLNIIQQAVRNLYGGQAGFTGLATGVLAGSNTLPAKMVTAGGAGLANSFNGAVQVNAATIVNTDDGFTIEFDGIPTDACVVLGTKDYGRALSTLTVDGSSLIAANQTNVPDAATASATCQAVANNHALIWTFAN